MSRLAGRDHGTSETHRSGAPESAVAVVPLERKAGLARPPRQLIRGLDRLLRRVQGIEEFSADPRCLLRIAKGRIAKGRNDKDLLLADGCRIRRGSEVVDLHLWNEHLSSLPSPHRGLARAGALRRGLGISLRELAARIETDPSLAGVGAVRARIAFVPRRRLRKLRRIARAYGFEGVAVPAADWHSTRPFGFWENLLIWALAWTFNPSTLRRTEMLRDCCELWISRDALIARYGDRVRPPLVRGSLGTSGNQRERNSTPRARTGSDR